MRQYRRQPVVHSRAIMGGFATITSPTILYAIAVEDSREHIVRQVKRLFFVSHCLKYVVTLRSILASNVKFNYFGY